MEEDMDYQYGDSNQSPPVDCSDGDAAFHEERYKEAKEIYSNKIETSQSVSAFCHLLLRMALCNLMLKNLKEAKEDATRATQLDDKCIQAFITMAKCYLAQGSTDSAEVALSKAYEIDPHDKSLRDELRRLYKIKSFEESLLKAFRNENYKEMEMYAMLLMNEAPDCDRYKVEHAKSLAYLRKFPEALGEAEGVLQRNPTDCDALYVLAFCRYHQGELPLADEILQKINPGDAKSQKMREKIARFKQLDVSASQACEKGNFGEAINLHTEALSVDETNECYRARLYFNRGLIAGKKLKWFKQAIEDFTKAAKLVGDFWIISYNKGKCFSFTGEYENASKEYEILWKMTGNKDHKTLMEEALDAHHNLSLSSTTLSLPGNFSASDIEEACAKEVKKLRTGFNPWASDEVKEAQAQHFEAVKWARKFLLDHLKKKDGFGHCDLLSLDELFKTGL